MIRLAATSVGVVSLGLRRQGNRLINAGYRRIEVASSRRTKGEYRCLLCDHVLEVFDGSTEVGIRLTVHPEKTAK
jgi:hypothetical protein